MSNWKHESKKKKLKTSMEKKVLGVASGRKREARGGGARQDGEERLLGRPSGEGKVTPLSPSTLLARVLRIEKGREGRCGLHGERRGEGIGKCLGWKKR